jgi:hypothetical protein
MIISSVEGIFHYYWLSYPRILCHITLLSVNKEHCFQQLFTICKCNGPYYKKCINFGKVNLLFQFT